MLKQNYNEITCTYCNSRKIISYKGFQVCKQCGTVLDKIYEDSNFQYHQSSTNHATQYVSRGKQIDKVGGLGSEIGYYKHYKYKSSNGKSISNEKQTRFARLEKNYHSKLKVSSTQTHIRTFTIFNKISLHLNIPNSIKERSSYLYWKKVNNSQQPITNHVLLIALCLLYAIREKGHKIPIKFQEIIKAFKDYGHRVTNKNILNLATELDMSLNKPTIRRSEDYIDRIADSIVQGTNLQIYYEKLLKSSYKMLLMKISQLFLSKISTKERGGVQPFGFACAIVYLSDRAIARYLKKVPHLTQKKVASFTNSKEYTIRDHCYKSLSKKYTLHESVFHEVIKEFLDLI